MRGVKAREKRDDYRKLLRQRVDLGDIQNETKAAKRCDDPNSFEVMAREWIEKNRKKKHGRRFESLKSR